MLQGKILSDVEVFGDLLVRSKYEEPYGGEGARSSNGFTSGGMNSSNVEVNIINKFSFSGGNASDHGDLTVNKEYPSGVSTSYRGYNAGGNNTANVSTIDKFNFSSNVTATGHGSLSSARWGAFSFSPQEKAFVAGGRSGSSALSIIDSFEYSIENINANHGNLYTTRGNVWRGITTQYRAFCPSGYNGSSGDSSIEYFEFKDASIQSNHGDLLAIGYNNSGCGSSSQGFITGEVSVTNRVQRFDFSSNVVADDHCDLIASLGQTCMCPSPSRAYICGGYNGSSYVNYIQYFEYSSTNNATDQGDLTSTRRYVTTHNG